MRVVFQNRFERKSGWHHFDMKNMAILIIARPIKSVIHINLYLINNQQKILQITLH